MSKRQQIVLDFYRFTCFKPAMLLLFFWNTFSVFSAAPVYVKTIDRKPLQLYVNTSNDILLLQKGMLERYTADGIFFRIMVASTSTNTQKLLVLIVLKLFCFRQIMVK